MSNPKLTDLFEVSPSSVLRVCAARIFADAQCAFSRRVAASMRLPDECQKLLSMVVPIEGMISLQEIEWTDDDEARATKTKTVVDAATGERVACTKVLRLAEIEPVPEAINVTSEELESLCVIKTPGALSPIRLVCRNWAVTFPNAEVARYWWMRLLQRLADIDLSKCERLVRSWRLPAWFSSLLFEVAMSTPECANANVSMVKGVLGIVGLSRVSEFQTLNGLLPQVELRTRRAPTTLRDANNILMDVMAPLDLAAMWHVFAVRMLIDGEAKPNIREAAELANTALHFRLAVERCNFNVTPSMIKCCGIFDARLIRLLQTPSGRFFGEERLQLLRRSQAQINREVPLDDPNSSECSFYRDLMKSVGLGDAFRGGAPSPGGDGGGPDGDDATPFGAPFHEHPESVQMRRNAHVIGSPDDANVERRTVRMRRSQLVEMLTKAKRRIELLHVRSLFVDTGEEEDEFAEAADTEARRADPFVVVQQLPLEFQVPLMRYVQRLFKQLPAGEENQLLVTTFSYDSGVALDRGGSVALIATAKAWRHLSALQMQSFLTTPRRLSEIHRNRHADIFELMRAFLCGDPFTVMTEFSNVLISYISSKATLNSVHTKGPQIGSTTIEVRSYYLRYLLWLLYTLFPMPHPRCDDPKYDRVADEFKIPGTTLLERVKAQRAIHDAFQEEFDRHLQDHEDMPDEERFGAEFELAAARVLPQDCFFDSNTGKWIGLRKTPHLDIVIDPVTGVETIRTLPHFYYGLLAFLCVDTDTCRFVHRSVVWHLREYLYDLVVCDDEVSDRLHRGRQAPWEGEPDCDFYTYWYVWCMCKLFGGAEWIALEPFTEFEWDRENFRPTSKWVIPRTKWRLDPDMDIENGCLLFEMPRLPEEEAALPFHFCWYQLCAESLIPVEQRRRMFFCTRLDEHIIFPDRQMREARTSHREADSEWTSFSERVSLYGDAVAPPSAAPASSSSSSSAAAPAAATAAAAAGGNGDPANFATIFREYYSVYFRASAERLPTTFFSKTRCGGCSLIPRELRLATILTKCTLEPLLMLVTILRDGALQPVPKRVLRPWPGLPTCRLPGYPHAVMDPAYRHRMNYHDHCLAGLTDTATRFNSFSWRLTGLYPTFSTDGTMPRNAYYLALVNGPMPYSPAAAHMASCQTQAAELIAQLGQGLPLACLKDKRVGRFGFECTPVAMFSLAPYMEARDLPVTVTDEQMIRLLSNLSYWELTQLSKQAQETGMENFLPSKTPRKRNTWSF